MLLFAGWVEMAGASTTTSPEFEDVVAAEVTELTVLFTSTV